MWIISLPFALFFYAGFAEFSFPLAYSATLNFLLLSGIWVATVFISTLKNYGAITSTFLVGILVSYSATLWLAEDSTPSDLILAFSTGPLFIFCSLLANIMSEYPKLLKFPCHATAYFRTYWDIALGGFFYSLAIWVDKWIMWFSPEASHAIPHLPSYPTYNTALFISYLSVVPAMALFMYDLETEFFDIYVKFYRDIQDHANLRKIQQNYLGIMRAVASSCRNILVLQAAICLLSLTMAPKIFELLHLPYLQLSMFRYGLLGASFQLFTLLLTIFLAYFEFRRQTMWVFFIFFISNTLFTLLTLRLGFPFYGTGYFLSTVLTFGVAAFVTEKKMQNLLYHSFVTNNDAILRSR